MGCWCARYGSEVWQLITLLHEIDAEELHTLRGIGVPNPDQMTCRALSQT